jgi:hypothetical protein
VILLTLLIAAVREVRADARDAADDGQWKGAGASAKRDRAQAVSRIAFGSCFKTDFPLGIWDVIAKGRPDLFLFIGDVIYKDTAIMEEKRVEFVKLGAVPGFANFRKSTEILAVWDDHDYGENDGGADYPSRRACGFAEATPGRRHVSRGYFRPAGEARAGDPAGRAVPSQPAGSGSGQRRVPSAARPGGDHAGRRSVEVA